MRTNSPCKMVNLSGSQGTSMFVKEFCDEEFARVQIRHGDVDALGETTKERENNYSKRKAFACCCT